MQPVQLIADITLQGQDAYRVRLEQGNNRFNTTESTVALGQDSALTVNKQKTTLGELWRKLIEYDADALHETFNERGQLEIGSYLYEQLFGSLKENDRARLLQEAAIELRIVTEDEMIARLPWTLLFADRRFLAATGWTISLSSPRERCMDIELPPSPRIMIIMPQPNGWGATSSKVHLQDLERNLSSVNRLHVCGQNLYLVETWEEFQEQLPLIRPHVLYFYGHGDSDTSNSQLIFAERVTNEPVLVSAQEFTNALHALGQDAPSLAYINCCLGDAGGLLGVGRQINRIVPAVITNCTMAQVDAAQAQALDIWRSILLDGLSPHQAIAAMRKHLGGQAGALSDVRWLTPVAHCGYSTWNFKPPKSPGGELPLGWESTLDRVIQTGVVMLHSGTMLQENKLRTLIFLWYGKDGQGVEPFYDRLDFELRNRLKDVGLYPVRPEFPLEFFDFDLSVSDMMAHGFKVQSYDEVMDKIRFEVRRIGKRQTIVYIRLPVIKKGMEFYQTKQLKNLLDWLEAKFADRFGEHVFALIGLAYVVKEPVVFREVIDQRFEEDEYEDLALYVLDELGTIKRKDLADFLRMNKIYLPRDQRKRIIDEIMEKTGGDYEKALEELKLLINRKSVRSTQIRQEVVNDGDY